MHRRNFQTSSLNEPDISQKLKELRIYYGSGKNLAQALDVTPEHLSRLINNKVGHSKALLGKVDDLLDYPIAAMISRYNDQQLIGAILDRKYKQGFDDAQNSKESKDA